MTDLQTCFVDLIGRVKSDSKYALSLFEKGKAPDRYDICGAGYRGFNTHPLAKIGGAQEFMKVFFWDPEANGREDFLGYNLITEQAGLEFTLELESDKNGDPMVQGAFHVDKPSDIDRHALPNSVLFNYQECTAPVSEKYPIALNKVGEGLLLRDYVTMPFGTPDILLGRPFLRIPGVEAYIPMGYFILLRDRPMDMQGSMRRVREHFARRR